MNHVKVMYACGGPETNPVRVVISFLLAFTEAAFTESGAFINVNFNALIHGTFCYVHPFGGSMVICTGSWDDSGYSNDIWLGYYAGFVGAAGRMDYSFIIDCYDHSGP